MHEFKNTASEAWCQQSAGWKCMSLRRPPQRLGVSNLQAGDVWVYEYRLRGLIPEVCRLEMHEFMNTASEAWCQQSAGCMEMYEFKNTASAAWCQPSSGWKCMCVSLRIPPQRLGASNLQAGNA
jgi:hypothetical protein